MADGFNIGFDWFGGEEPSFGAQAGAAGGGTLGATAGVIAGGALGSLIAPGLGTVIGAGLGGLAGAGLGGTAGYYAGEAIGDSMGLGGDTAGETTKKIEEASAAQQAALQEAQAITQPWTEAGQAALQSQQALAGLLGPEAQAAAIAQLEASPQFQSMLAQGERAILQNAAATGGLRGGNVQAMLAQYRPQLLSSIIEQQYARLGGLTAGGLTAGMGQAGIGADIAAAQAGGMLGAAQLQYMHSQQQQRNLLAAIQAASQAAPGIIKTAGALQPGAGAMMAGGPPQTYGAPPQTAGGMQGQGASPGVYQPSPLLGLPEQGFANV